MTDSAPQVANTRLIINVYEQECLGRYGCLATLVPCTDSIPKGYPVTVCCGQQETQTKVLAIQSADPIQNSGFDHCILVETKAEETRAYISDADETPPVIRLSESEERSLKEHGYVVYSSRYDIAFGSTVITELEKAQVELMVMGIQTQPSHYAWILVDTTELTPPTAQTQTETEE